MEISAFSKTIPGKKNSLGKRIVIGEAVIINIVMKVVERKKYELDFVVSKLNTVSGFLNKAITIEPTNKKT